MTIFDLLFLAAFFVSLGTLLTAAVAAIRGRQAAAIRILRNWSIGVAVYVTAGFLVVLLKPQRIKQVGDPWCFDDWCLTAQKVSHTPTAYKIDLLISSRARRVSQRAKGAWIYLIDDKGERYPPQPDSSAAPLDVLLQPDEEVSTSRVFQVPADVRPLGLITGHGGPPCGPMALLIIGQAGCLFHKPTMISLGLD